MIFKGEREGVPEQSADFYLLNPPRQPKLEIADYVERSGIFVPRRFVDLNEALSSGKPFIVRSEHPQDYNGISGLLRSFKITEEQINNNKRKYLLNSEIDWDYVFSSSDLRREFEAENKAIAQLGNVSQEKFEHNLKLLSTRKIFMYCQLLGIDPQKFFSEISYSYWELLGGYNRTIVADSAVPQRYHIFTTTSDGYRGGYSIIENGKIVTNLSPEVDSSLLSPAVSYESVRNLGRFNKNQCPLIEMQTVDGNDYFLQYHRGTDFSPSQFVLDRELEKDEMKATFVRGATLKEGMVVKVNVHNDFGGYNLQQEDGAFDFHFNSSFVGLMIRQRKIQFCGFNAIKNKYSMPNHMYISMLFKTPVAVAVSLDDMNFLLEGVSPYSQDVIRQLELRVISDGKKAYIKRAG